MERMERIHAVGSLLSDCEAALGWSAESLIQVR